MHRYVDKTPVERGPAPPLDIGSAVHEGAEAVAKAIRAGVTDTAMLETEGQSAAAHYVSTKASYLDVEARAAIVDHVASVTNHLLGLPRSREIIGVERKIIENTPEGNGVIGFVDRLDREPQDTLGVVDYKVTKKTKTRTELADDPQLGLYGYFMSKMFSWAKRVRVSHVYPNHGSKVVSAIIDDDAMEAAIDRVDSTVALASADTTWEPNPSRLCDWCEYKGVCPAFATLGEL